MQLLLKSSRWSGPQFLTVGGFINEPGKTRRKCALAQRASTVAAKQSARCENPFPFVCPRSVFHEIDRWFYLNKHRHEPWHVCDMVLACVTCFELAMMSARHQRCP